MSISTDNYPSTEFSEQFVRGMLNAMAVSFHKYGPLADAYPSKVDALESLNVRLDKYDETGNTEYLIDVANFAMIEFMRPSHPRAFYKATDSDGSPGRVVHGASSPTQKSNSELKG